MKKLALLSLVLCLFAPALLAVNDDGTASVPGKNIVVSDYNHGERGSITTIFASNNQYAGNTFDIDVVTSFTEITAMDVNCIPTGIGVDIDLYYKNGTAFGFETNPGAWTLFASGSGVSAGQDVPTFCDVSGNGQPFPPDLWGIAMHASSYTAGSTIRYTNGQGVYSNADVTLTTHHGLADPVFTGAFYPRQINCTLYYNSGPPPALIVNPKEVSAWFGGTATFSLFGDGYPFRDYILCGSMGTTGINLPGGGVLPLSPDFTFYTVLALVLGGGGGLFNDFIGILDANGEATATLTLPGHCQLFQDIELYFAWTTRDPFDFQSNNVMLTITGAPPPMPKYYWDDGTSENALGWTAGGVACWLQYFDSGAGDTIAFVHSCFGQAGSGSGPANGTPIDVWVWSDPNQDGEPSDGLVLGHGTGAVANTNTNDFNVYNVDVPAAVTGLFFVGCSLDQPVGVYAAPMDQNTLGLGVSYFGGAFTGSPYGYWDPYNLSTHPIYLMGAIGFDSVWLLRADV